MPTARLEWYLYVECPKCKEDFDLVDQDSNNDYNLAYKIFTNRWDDVKGYECVCDHCGYEFDLDGVEY